MPNHQMWIQQNRLILCGTATAQISHTRNKTKPNTEYAFSGVYIDNQDNYWSTIVTSDDPKRPWKQLECVAANNDQHEHIRVANTKNCIKVEFDRNNKCVGVEYLQILLNLVRLVIHKLRLVFLKHHQRVLQDLVVLVVVVQHVSKSSKISHISNS